MDANECAESLCRYFGGKWFAVLEENEFVCGQLLILSVAPVKIGFFHRMKANGQLSFAFDGKYLPNGHLLYSELSGRSCSWNSVFAAIKKIHTDYYCCCGVYDEAALQFYRSDLCPSSIELLEVILPDKDGGHSSTMLSPRCPILIRRPLRGCAISSCPACCYLQDQLLRRRTIAAGISTTTSGRISTSAIRATLEETRTELDYVVKKLATVENELEKMRQRIQRPTAIQCLELLENDTNSSSSTVPKMASLFLYHQMKALTLSDQRGMRWEREFINFAMRLCLKSTAAYEFLIDSGTLRLPSVRTLSRYFSKLPKCEGANDDVIKEIVAEYLNTFRQPYAKFLAMSIDEMKIRANVVYDKRTNELVGYVGSTDMMSVLNEMAATSDDSSRIATDALVVYIRGIGTGFERAIAWFPVRCLCGAEIMSVMWTVKQKIEFFGLRNGEPNLKVVTVTCDGLAANHLFFKLHVEDKSALGYKAKDPLDPSNFVYFLVDPPHLLKTIRNNCEKSADDDKAIKRLKINQPILWRHVEQLYADDLKDTWRLLPKLSHRHVFLAPSDKMKVKLAAQVLSESVSIAMAGRPEMEDTSRLFGITNRLFDMLNGRYCDEARHRRNPDLSPFSSADDPRLQWLQSECLRFFLDWEALVNESPLSNIEKQRALMSYQTRSAIFITINGFVEAVRWILSQPDAPPYILSSVFNQDRLEVYFGHVRCAGGSNDHPDWARFKRVASALNYVDASKLRAIRGSNVS